MVADAHGERVGLADVVHQVGQRQVESPLDVDARECECRAKPPFARRVVDILVFLHK